jgi:SGNH domain-containing protein
MAALVEGYSELIAKLEAAGKKVIVLTELPQLAFDPTDCVALRPLRINPRAIRRPCTHAPDEVQLALVRTFVDALKSRHEGLMVFDIAALLCDQSQCTVMPEGRLLYRDRNHLSLAGSRHVARHLFALTHAVDRVSFGPIVK